MEKKDLGERALRAEVEEREARARKTAAEAEEATSRAQAQKQDTVRAFLDMIDAHISSVDEDAGLLLKLAKLLEENPDLEEHMRRLRELLEDHGIRAETAAPHPAIEGANKSGAE